MIEEKLTKEEFQKQLGTLLNDDISIILFGAGEIGKRAALRMDYLNIKNKLVCFADNNAEKIGESLERVPILSKSQIKEEYPNAAVIITIGDCNVTNEIEQELRALGFTFFISRQALLHRFGYDGIREKALVKCDDKYFLRQIVVSITEKCTLRCKHCSQLMPRFNSPKNIDADKVVESVKSLLNMVDYVQDVTILGGEPLLHPELAKICTEIGKLKNEGKAKFVSMISNATLVPSMEVLKVLKEYGITLILSDYGRLSKKMKEIQQICEVNGVEWRYSYTSGTNEEKLEYWTAMGKLEKQNLPEIELDRKFENCNSVYDCNMIYDGRYYFCCLSAFLTGLGITTKADDSFDLLNHDIPSEELKEKWREFMFKEKRVIACDYCNPQGRVPVAEQL